MWKLIDPGAWSAVPVQSAWQTSPSRQIVSTILKGPLPHPSSSTQSVNVCGSSGMYVRMMCAIARRVRSRSASHADLEGLRPEALADLDDPPLRGAAAADDRHQVAPVRVRRARVVEDHVERRLVEDALVEDLDRRDPDALLPDREGVRDLAARHLAAHVHHVAEERGERDALALVEDRQDHEPVVAVGDRALAEVRVVQQDHVALRDLAAEAVDHLGDVRAELAHDHLAARRCRSSGTRRAAPGSWATWLRA